METAKEKKLHIVRNWFKFLTEHTIEEMMNSITLIQEGGGIANEMKILGIPSDVFKPITRWLNNPNTRNKIVPVLKSLSTAATETDDRSAVMAAYVYILCADKKMEWGDDLVPILEWYEALYEWGIPTMKELDEINPTR